MLAQLAQSFRAASRRSTAFSPVAASLRAPPPLAAAPHRSAAVWTPTASFHASGPRRGLEEFYDARHRSKAPEDGAAGRAWEACELRRKSFNDLHRLWWTLYKERNVLLTESARARRNGMRLKYPQRKAAVRKSMARIKQVLAERRKIYREQPVPELPEDDAEDYMVSFNDGRTSYPFQKEHLQMEHSNSNYEIWWVQQYGYKKLLDECRLVVSGSKSCSSKVSQSVSK